VTSLGFGTETGLTAHRWGPDKPANTHSLMDAQVDKHCHDLTLETRNLSSENALVSAAYCTGLIINTASCAIVGT